MAMGCEMIRDKSVSVVLLDTHTPGHGQTGYAKMGSQGRELLRACETLINDQVPLADS